MAVTPAFITAALERELSSLSDQRVVEHVRSLLVPPRLEMRAWDYGPADEYPCWLVLEHQKSGTAITYCEFGFGPTSPWGLLFLTAENTSMGMDCGWYDRFLKAYFESPAVTDLPIWRVLRDRNLDDAPEVITGEASSEQTWSEVMRLRERNDGFRYHCGQVIYSLRDD